MFCEVYRSESERIEKEKPLSERLTEHFNEDISDEVDSFVINTVLYNSRYIFIKKVNIKNNNRYLAYCTHCKEEYEIDEYTAKDIFHHNNRCYCQKCQSKCTAKHERYRRGTLIDRATFITYEKSKIESGTIVAKGYFVSRDYTENYKDVTTEYVELSRYVFKIGESYMLTKSYYYGWSIRDRCCSYKDGYTNYMSYVDKESIKRAVSNTEFRFSPYKRYLLKGEVYRYDNDMTLFFYQYCKYPIVEKLVKSGFKILADFIVEGRSLERSVNFKQTDLFKFLGINRAEAKEIINSGVRCSPRFFNVYKFARKERLGWDISKIEKISNEYNYDTLKRINEYTGISRALTYLKKQALMKDRYYSVHSTWFDYLSDCKTLGYNLKDKNILFPKDLTAAHQNTIKLVKYKENKELDENIEKISKSIEKLKFEYKDIIIRPSESSKEIVKEGEKLNHCVGRYAERYAKGETYILLIRDKNNINKPYYTVEISKAYKIIQVRGKSNSSATEEVKEFIEVYKKEVLEKVAKKSRRNKKVA